jgi:uracil-DNA glycosylase family 4
MIKTGNLGLDDLYIKEKITPSVEVAILKKENFTEIQPKYCEKVCKLRCKSYGNVTLNHDEVDVLVIQDHDAPDDKYMGKIKEGTKIERTHRTIVDELCQRNLRGLTYRITNVTKCKITERDITKGKPPTSAILLKCSPYLLKEIELSKPKVIISLTNNATKTLGLKKSNYTHRGEIHTSPVHPNVVLTLHPKIVMMIRQNSSGKMWGPDYWDVIDRDFNKAGRIARGQLSVPGLDESIEKAKQHILITRTLEDVRKAVDELSRLPRTAIRSFDTETTGLDGTASDAKLLSIQFGYRLPNGKIRAIVFPLWHKENKGYDPNEAWALITPLLEDDTPKIGHNAKFDVLYIYFTTGVRVKGILFDTMLVLHSINSGIQGNYTLKRSVWDWFPESGLGGYEDKLPGLTKSRKETTEEEDSVL